MPGDAGTERRRLIYSGRVQGVGFRYTTASIARRYPVVGFVRNLPGGTVELVAEATPDVLDEFLGEIDSNLGRYVEACRPLKADPHEDLTEFGIRY